MKYLVRLLDSTDPSASLKHFAYLMVVSFGCVWLSWGARKDIDAEWVASFGLLLSAVTVGKVVSPAGQIGTGAKGVPTSTSPDGAQ